MKAPACYTLKQKRVALQYKLFQYSQRIKDDEKKKNGVPLYTLKFLSCCYLRTDSKLTDIYPKIPPGVGEG